MYHSIPGWDNHRSECVSDVVVSEMESVSGRDGTP